MDAVFLAVDAVLLPMGDMSAITAGIEPFLAPNAAILGMEISRLPAGDLAVTALHRDLVELMIQAVIDFGAARMMPAPTGGIGIGGDASPATAMATANKIVRFI
jgi:hypothetical protein